MENLVIFFGDEIRINRPFMSCILRKFEEKFLSFYDIKFLNKSDSKLHEILEQSVKNYKFVTIFSTAENFNFISKILASLSSDILELTSDEILAPSMAIEYQKDSFLIKIHGNFVNLLKVSPLENLPEILQNPQINSTSFFIFDSEISYIKLVLEPLKRTYKINLSITKFSEFLVLIRVANNEFSDIEGFLNNVLHRLNFKVILGENLFEFLVKKLAQNGKKITFAESCTAGLIASKIGEISGASEVFDGSLVTYSNEIKNIWLSVESETLSEFGAVSKECVSEMLSGALESSGADFALAVSGIAGPTGGSLQKPVGTIFIGVKEKNAGEIIELFNLKGDRNYIREQSVNIALCLLFKLKISMFFKENF